MEKAIAAVISGKVQGVGFRAATLRKAHELALAGWVRNRPDGTVETLAQGTPATVDAFLDWCRQGPSGARVKAVQVQEAIFDKSLIEFTIRRD